MLIAILILNIWVVLQIATLMRIVRHEFTRNELAINEVKDKLDKIFPDPEINKYDA